MKWRHLDESEHVFDMQNYLSAAGPKMSRILLEQFREEEKMGMMIEVTEQEARVLYPGDRLRIAAQGAIEKSDETFRIVHDATHGVNVNTELKVRDQVRMPTAGDGRAVMELCSSERPGVHFALQADVSKAHRRYLHKKADWGLLACKAEQKPNKTATASGSTRSALSGAAQPDTGGPDLLVRQAERYFHSSAHPGSSYSSSQTTYDCRLSGPLNTKTYYFACYSSR